MEKFQRFFNEHKIIILTILGMLLIGGVLLFISIKSMFSAGLDILVVPADAKIMIDGERFENEKQYSGLMARTAHVEISMDGFDTQSYDLELKKNETTKIYTYLTGNDAWYEGHKNDERVQTSLELINEYHGEVQVEDLNKKYPILSILPIVYEKYLNNYTEYVSYRVDFGAYDECEGEYCVMITDYTGGNRERALTAIRNKGFSPDDYEVHYRRK